LSLKIFSVGLDSRKTGKLGPALNSTVALNCFRKPQ
jgi:hypothetical protein